MLSNKFAVNTLRIVKNYLINSNRYVSMLSFSSSLVVAAAAVQWVVPQWVYAKQYTMQNSIQEAIEK